LLGVLILLWLLLIATTTNKNHRGMIIDM